MLVKIIQGAYGHRAAGSHFLQLIHVGETCEVTAEEAERLAQLGVAEKLEEKHEEEPFEDDDEVDVESLSFAELKELAEVMGLNVSKLRSKKDLIAAINGQE